MRNIRTVIEQIYEAVPESEVEFRNRLTKLANDSVYQPPESITYWIKLQDCLHDYIGQPVLDWQWEVCSIITTKSVKELKEIKL